MSERANLFSVGKVLSGVISDACNGRYADAIDAFPKAMLQLRLLSSVGERFEAVEFALEIADRGFEAAAIEAWHLIVDACQYFNEPDGDLALIHLEKAICVLACIEDPVKRLQAIFITKQRCMSLLDPEQLKSFHDLVSTLMEIDCENGSNNLRRVVLAGLILE